MNTNRKLRAMLLGSGAVLALASGPALAGQADDLRTQIDQLQARLDQMEKQQATTDAKVSAAPTDAVVGGDFPGSFKLPGSDTSVAIHGYTKLDMLVDFDQQNGDSFAFTGILPNRNPGQHRDTQFRLHAKQSRFSIETRTPTLYGQMKTFIQGDFLGATGNQKVSNSTSFRLRHAYGELGPVLAGQTWTLFQELNTGEVLDFNGPVGVIFARQAQVRYTQSMGKWGFAASLENNQNDFTTNTGASPAATIPSSSTVPAAQDSVTMPDVVGRLQYTDSWGQLSAYGLLRRFAVDNGGGGNSTAGASQHADAIGGGGQVGGYINAGKWVGGAFEKDQIGFNAIYGSGMGRYAAAGGALNQAAVVKNFGTSAVKIETQMEIGGSAWVTHNWTNQLRSTLVYGIQHQHFSSVIPVTTGQTDQLQSVHANIIWSPVKAVNIGLEFIYGLKDFRKGAAAGVSTSDSSRLQASLQYVF